MKKLVVILCLIVVALASFIAPVTFADSPLRSTNYEFEETALGGIGLTSTQSANYKAAESAGILGFGTSSSSSFQIKAGHTTTNDPALSFAVDSPTVNFGSFSTTSTAVTTSTFQVADYTSYGYVVQTLGNAPSNGSHTISAMTTTGPSTTGTEQFGINLVANTSPSSFGANPNHGQFGYGSSTSNYSTANNYRFVSGETIASAPQSSGETLYTISYIINVDDFTPGGIYTSNQTILCTATY